MHPLTLEVVRKNMSTTEPLTPGELVEATGLSRASVYNALSALRADRHRVDKNLYGYTLPEERERAAQIDEPGTINGVSWADYVTYALAYVQKVHLKGTPSAESYVEGFQQIADTFQTITDHVRAVQHRPDWRIVLGLDKEN